MPDAVLVVTGVGLVVLVLADVFYTVLFPASGHGPLRTPLATLVRRVFGLTRYVAGPDHRRRVLAYAGPVQIAVTLLTWFLLLLVGWAAVYRPALGSGVVAASGPTHVSWGTALYFSGYALTTLGTGDVVATTAGYRLLSISEAATGFATITLVISYFYSVYTTLVSRNSFAMALDHRSGGTGRGQDVVAALWQEGEVGAALHLAEMATGLRTIAQTHSSYPVLRSFHYTSDYKALPQILLTCLEASTLLRTSLDLEDPRVASRSPLGGTGVAEVHDAARAVCSQLLHAPSRRCPPARQRRAWAVHHAAAVRALSDAGVPVRTDPAATEAYVDVRAEWDPALAELAVSLFYDWPGDLSAPR